MFDSTWIVGLGACGLVGMYARLAVQSRRALRRRRAQNYAWYQSTYPQHMSEHGPQCFACKGKHLHTRSFADGTIYMREHFCATCGKTLYFSEN